MEKDKKLFTIDNPIIFMENQWTPGDYRGQDEAYDTIFDASGKYVSLEYALALANNNKKAAELITNLALDKKELREELNKLKGLAPSQKE